MDKYLIIYLLITGIFLFSIISTPIIMHYSSFGQTMFDSYSSICHQKPSRSFLLLGNQFPVCSRCLSFYAALFIGGLVYYIINKRLEKQNQKLYMPFWIFIVCLLPMAIDGTFQYLGFWESTNVIRVITGFLIGFVIPFYLFTLKNKHTK